LFGPELHLGVDFKVVCDRVQPFINGGHFRSP
jgi:hypothetical protein